nr:Large delta antigen like [Ipomoea batatas]
MASLNLFFSPAAAKQRRVFTAATAAKISGGSGEKKGLLDWILGGLQKQDQLLETDPILKKVEGKSSATTVAVGRRKSVAAPPPKSNTNGGGFGGFGLQERELDLGTVEMLFMKWMQSLTASALWESSTARRAVAAVVAFSDEEEVTFRLRAAPVLADGYMIRKAANTTFPPTSLRYLIGDSSHFPSSETATTPPQLG